MPPALEAGHTAGPYNVHLQYILLRDDDASVLKIRIVIITVFVHIYKDAMVKS